MQFRLGDDAWRLADQEHEQIECLRGEVHDRVIATRLSPRGRAATRIAGALCGLAFASLLVWYGWRIMLRNLDVDTTTLFFSQGVVYAIVPVAAIAVGVYAIADLVAGWRALSSDAGARA